MARLTQRHQQQQQQQQQQQRRVLSRSWRVSRTHADSYTGGKVAVSGDGEWLVCWCSEAVKLLEIGSGVVRREFRGDEDGFVCFSLSPDSSELATAQKSGLMRVWSTASGECLREWRGHDLPITCLAYDASGSFIASGSVDKTVRVWNAAKGFCTHNFRGHEDVVTCTLFHGDATRLQLFTASRDGGIHVWDLRNKSGHQRLYNHMSCVTGMAFDAASGLLVSVARDKVINVWDTTDSSRCSHVKTIPALEEFESVCAIDSFGDVDGSVFATAGSKGRVRVWSFTTLKCVFEQAALDDGVDATPLVDVVVRPRQQQQQQQQLVVVSNDHNLSLRDLPTFDERKLIVGFNDEILDVRCIPGVPARAAVATNSENVRIMDLASFDTTLLRGHTDVVLCVSVSGDGRYLASASKDNTIRVFDLHAPKPRCVAVGVGHTASVSAVAFSPKNNALLVSGGEDRTLKLWQFDGDVLRVLSTTIAHDKDINAIDFAPNGKLVASGSHDKTVKLWSHDGTSLSCAGTLRGHRRGVWGIAFSPIERVLASCSGDRSIKLWSLTDQSCVRTLEGHTSSVLRVQFLPNGLQLFSAGSDALVKLWTLHTSECVASYADAHDDRIWALAVSPDATLLTGAADSRLQVWRDVSAEEQAADDEERQQRVLLDQQLRNALRSREFLTAAKLALRATCPRRLYGVLEKLDDGAKGDEELRGLVRTLDADQLQRCVSYVVEWNTMSRHCVVGQRVLGALLSEVSRQQLLDVPRLSESLDALLAYSNRHFERTDKLLRKSFLLDYALKNLGDLDADAPVVAHPEPQLGDGLATTKRKLDDVVEADDNASKKAKKSKKSKKKSKAALQKSTDAADAVNVAA